ncbi:MAG: glycosyltransferase family 9 protein [Methylocella sp.]
MKSFNHSDVAILNGFGRSLGDSVIGLQALKLAIEAGVIPPHPVLFRLPDSSTLIPELYYAARDFAAVRTLPWADETPGPPPAAAADFSRVIDLRDFAFDPSFRGVAMIDFFLSRLGLDPAEVESGRKRNSWLAPRAQRRQDAAASGYVLVCPTASMELRRMPTAIHDATMAWLQSRSGRMVLSQSALPRESSLAGLCGLVASAGLIVTTDTGMVHLADAFSVPCLAFFTTHRPEWRARDYPLCHAVYLQASSLPPALEFARVDEDIEGVRAAWFPHGGDFAWLTSALEEAVAMAETKIKPVHRS